MRNRPDSRGRLAGLQQAGSTWGVASDTAASVDVPDADESTWGVASGTAASADVPDADDSTWSGPDRPGPGPVHVGGWVPTARSADVAGPRPAPASSGARHMVSPTGFDAGPSPRRPGPAPDAPPGTTAPSDDWAADWPEELGGDSVGGDSVGGDSVGGDSVGGGQLGGGAGADSRGPADPIGMHRVKRVRHSPSHAWGRVAQRWVPEPLRDARVDPGRRSALLLTVVGAVAALVAAVGVWRDRPEPRPVQAVSLAQVSDAPLVSAGVATTRHSTGLPRVPGTTRPTGAEPAVSSQLPGSGVLVVSVTGAVRHPGLVRVPAGSRVADAITGAGGATDAADLTGLNLAARLTDGASVVVAEHGVTAAGGSSMSGSEAGAGAGPSVPATSGPVGKVDLNTADVATLDALPGVGPVTAAGIVAWRDKNGRYTSVQQLQEIPGIGPAKYAVLAPLVTV